jgi:hypothetical protein
MTPALATPERTLFAGSPGHAGAPAGGRLTLEERLGQALEAARAEGRAECPVCHGPMSPASGGAACRDCGSSIR